MACLTRREQRDFARLLGKIEGSLDLVQTIEAAGKAGGY